MIKAIELSLAILAIYICFRQGMVLGWLRIIVANFLDKRAGKVLSFYIQKPLFECLPCMAGIWTILLTWQVNVFQILTVCGLNFVIAKLFLDETNS